MALVQYVILSDSHFPYEGKAYYKALEMMRSMPNLKHIYLNGDMAEIESVSSHPKGPRAFKVLADELEYINKKFDQLEKMFPAVPVTFIEGNHCSRVLRYIRDVAPEMWGLIHTPKLFKFDERKNFRFVPYGPTQWEKCGKTKDLWIRHEPLVMGTNHAKGTADLSTVSICYGHVHQRAEYTAKKHGPKPYHVTAYSPGWLGDVTKTCFDYRGSRDNWCNGFAVVSCDEKTGEYSVQLVAL